MNPGGQTNHEFSRRNKRKPCHTERGYATDEHISYTVRLTAATLSHTTGRRWQRDICLKRKVSGLPFQVRLLRIAHAQGASSHLLMRSLMERGDKGEYSSRLLCTVDLISSDTNHYYMARNQLRGIVVWNFMLCCSVPLISKPLFSVWGMFSHCLLLERWTLLTKCETP